MGLLKPRRRRKRQLRQYTTLRCMVAGHQVTWCKGLCEPVDGKGLCGREAPHALESRLQRAIARQRERDGSEES